MNVGDERTKSLWMDLHPASRVNPLRENVRVDTVVVGSGIAGLSAAYELAMLGQTVAVLDRGAIGRGMTARTTAHLVSISDDRFDQLIETRSEEIARLYYESQAASIDRIEAICDSNGIECDFRRLDGVLFPMIGSDTSEAKKAMQEEFEACKKLGVPVEKISGLPFHDLRDVQALRFPQQGRFHPLKYLDGLVEAIRSNKGRLYANTAVTSVEEADGGVVVTTASGYKVRAAHAIVATNSPINDRITVHTKQPPYRTYAMAFSIARGALDDTLYWDDGKPYHYVRLQPGRGNNDYLIVGGADHETGGADDADVRFEGLEAWMRSLFPKLGKETHRWSGQVLEPLDYTGFIGRNPGDTNIYIATGDSGQGITHGVVAGMLLKDLIANGSSPWKEVYEPDRMVPVGDWVGANIGAFQIFSEYLAPGEIGSFDELERGKGAIIRQGLQKVAAFRDEKGKLHLRSAACTHAGCHLHWNSLERCWDCPCHGSHFSVDGVVLNAPAVSDLAAVAAKSAARRKTAAKPAKGARDNRKRRAG